MLERIIKLILPRTYDRIRQRESDQLFHMMATQGALSARVGNDLVVCGLIRVIPFSDLRKEEQEKYA